MENKILGLDGLMHEVRPDISNLFEQDNNSQQNNLKTGMIMDSINNSNIVNENSNTISELDKNQPAKIDEKTLRQILAYQNKKPSIREYDKIGRNDPCPCGAVDENGKPKKYKNCCLKSGKYEKLVKQRKNNTEKEA